MFDGDRSVTKKVIQEVPLVFQIFLWSCIDNLLKQGQEVDNKHMFELKIEKKNNVTFQNIEHIQEESNYKRIYKIPFDDKVIENKVIVIDYGKFSKMILAEELQSIETYKIHRGN